VSQIKINRILLDEYAKKVSPQAIVLYLVIASLANPKTNKADPSIRQLAELTNKSIRVTQTYLRELEENGMINTERQFSEDGTPLPNRYELLV